MKFSSRLLSVLRSRAQHALIEVEGERARRGVVSSVTEVVVAGGGRSSCVCARIDDLGRSC